MTARVLATINVAAVLKICRDRFELPIREWRRRRRGFPPAPGLMPPAEEAEEEDEEEEEQEEGEGSESVSYRGKKRRGSPRLLLSRARCLLSSLLRAHYSSLCSRSSISFVSFFLSSPRIRAWLRASSSMYVRAPSESTVHCNPVHS